MRGSLSVSISLSLNACTITRAASTSVSVDVCILRQGKVDEGIVLCPAKNHSNGRVLIVKFHFAIVIIDVHLHLAEVLVREFSDLEVDQDIAPEDAVVEDEVHIEMVSIEGEPFVCRKGHLPFRIARIPQEFRNHFLRNR